MKIFNKGDVDTRIAYLEKEDSTYETREDVTKDLVRVHSTAKKDISSDIVLAKFEEEKDKIYVMEMYYCAAECKAVINGMITNYNKYREIHNEKGGSIPELTKEEIKEIRDGAEEVYNIFMNRINMLCLLNRNRANNYIIKHITGIRDEDEEIIKTQDKMSEVLQKTKDKFRNQEKPREWQIQH